MDNEKVELKHLWEKEFQVSLAAMFKAIKGKSSFSVAVESTLAVMSVSD